jgi:hypothetical protein
MALRAARLAALALAALAAAPASRAADEPAEPEGAADARPADPAADEAVARLRFAWPAPSRARVTYRRTRLRPGAPPSLFTARYEARVEPAADGLLIRTRGTAWRGDLPFAAALEKDAIRASEQVVQRIGREGEFGGLEGTEAMRAVLERVFEEAKVPPEAAARALPLAEAAIRAEAEELWNLAVGFWTGADLRVGQAYTLESEGEVPLVPGARARQSVEFAVRRRVPCAAGERANGCVEATLRSTPERAALERAADALLPKLAPAGADPAPAAGELAAESELVLVTDPATLLPRRLVWTQAVRLGGDEPGSVRAELVDRSEYDYRYLPPEPPRRAAPKKRPPRPVPPAAPAPAPEPERAPAASAEQPAKPG